ncbi:MAG: hypothetical protein K2X50_09770 [Gammaproteobacteria bacterium]|nr:hypothetical protein [Gammaproteobacteria bacterium]
MNAINAITIPVVNYYHDIPQDTAKKVMQSFIVVFVYRTLVSGNTAAGLYSATLTATATAVYSLITPLMKTFTNGRQQFNGMEEFFRVGLALIITNSLATALTDQSTFTKLGFNHDLYYDVVGSVCLHAIRIFLTTYASIPCMTFDTNRTNSIYFTPSAPVNL